MIKGNFTLDSSHTLGKTEDALLVITQVQKVLPSGQPSSLDSHSLVICSQGGFFDDVKVWSGEDIKALQAAIDTLQNTKQDVTSEDLATIAKTIVGAINEVYKGGLEDASIATNKIEDGAVTEPKLDTDLTAKVNNNVKTIEQTLTDDEVGIASKNLKFRDKNGNIFLDAQSFEDFDEVNVRNNLLCRSKDNAFTEAGDNSYNIIINSTNNNFGDDFSGNVCIGCDYNSFELAQDCVFNQGFSKNGIYAQIYNCIFGTGCVENIINAGIHNCIFGNGVSFIELNSNDEGIPQNIHILSGVYGKSAAERLAINIPDEYLNSSRELIIATKRTDGGPSTPEDLVMYYADEVVDKQNKQDTTLETTSKEVVGAINELFNGGVKDKSIAGAKLADNTVTNAKISDNAITTDKIVDGKVTLNKLAQAVQDTLGMVGINVKEINTDTDLNDLKEEGIYVLMSNNIYSNLPVSDGVSMSSQRLVYPSILVVSDYVVANNPVQTYIGLSSIYSYPLIKWRQYQENESKWLDWRGNDVYGIKKDVTALQGLINTKVKIINEDTDLNTLTEDGLYLLSAGHSYTNYPNSDGASSDIVYLNGPALLMVSRRYFETQISQVVLSVSNSMKLPLARNRYYDGSKWWDWNNDRMYTEIWRGVNNSVKYQDLSALTDTEINNIWDNN